MKKINEKIKLIRQLETDRGLIRGQADLAEKLNISLTTLKNYEAGRTQPPFEVMMNLCKVLKLNANIFQDETLFKIYSRRKIIKDNVLLRKGLCYVFAGLGMDVKLTNQQLDDICENKSLMHYFKFLNPYEPYGIKRRMPFVESIVGTIDLVCESLKEARSLLPQIGGKLKRTVILSKEMKSFSDYTHTHNISGLLNKTHNFIKYKDKDIQLFVKEVEIAVLKIGAFESFENQGEKICNNLHDLDKRLESLDKTLAEAKVLHLDSFKQIYLKIDEETKLQNI